MTSLRRIFARVAPVKFVPVVFVLIIGCSESQFPLAPVAGKVTLDGQPLAGAVVNFQPMATSGNDAGPGSTGRTDEEGKFELQTIDEYEGAVIGTHKIRIYSYSPESPNTSDSDDENTPTEKVPVRYNYRSELQFTVPSEGTQSADFDLDSTR